MSARARTLGFGAATAALTVVACALVAFAYFAWRGSRFEHLPMVVDGDWLMVRDDEMGFVPRPNAASEIRNIEDGYRFHVYTDRRGARVNAPGAQTGDAVDVMTVGCSFTWGAGIENEQTYAQRLGGALDASVANFAMGSFGSVQSFLMLLRNADLKPKVVVYGFIPDHLRRNVAPCAPNYVPLCAPVAYLQRDGDQVVLQPPHMEIFSPEDNQAFIAEVAMRNPAGLGALFRRAEWAARIAWLDWRHREIEVDQSPETAALALKVMVGAMADEAAKIGAKLVVLHMPYLVRGRVDAAPQALRDAIAGRDLTFVDFAPVAADFYARDPNGTLVLGQDPHPNPLAHQMIADTLAEPVRELLAKAPPR